MDNLKKTLNIYYQKFSLIYYDDIMKYKNLKYRYNKKYL